MKYWDQLSIQFMTEESDFETEESTVILTHKLEWRSQSMLDKFYTAT